MITAVDEYLPEEANSVTYGVGLKVNEKHLEDYSSKKIFRVCSTGVYDEGKGEGYKSIGEETERDSYKNQAVSKALKNLSFKNPISIIVDGKHFLNGSDNFTLGQKIRIIFLNSSPLHPGMGGSTDSMIDNKKSGDYLIFATRHMFKDERYDIRLFCIKFANFTNQDLNSFFNIE